jgi:hypothetical protein
MVLLIVIKTFLFWVTISTIGFVINEIYSYLTLRYKIIQLRSIVKGNVIVDTDLNTYQVLSNHILGCSDLQSKIFKLKINSNYKIKIYGINSSFTKVNVVDINPC